MSTRQKFSSRDSPVFAIWAIGCKSSAISDILDSAWLDRTLRVEVRFPGLELGLCYMQLCI